MAPTDVSAPLRGVVVGALSAMVTAAAHHLGGAMVPSESAIVALLAVCAGVGWIAATLRVRRWARLVLMLTLVAAQALGHLSLVVVDGHHHGGLVDGRMLAAHLLAVGAGACLIRGAELGIGRAVSALRRVLPLIEAVLVVEDTAPRTRPAFRPSVTPWLLDLSGRGTRGPPVPA